MEEDIDYSSVPPFLREVIKDKYLDVRAGEWDIEIPSMMLESESSFPIVWAIEMLQKFVAAFPWASYRTLKVGVSGEDTVSWSNREIPLDEWLNSLAKNGRDCDGVWATLDLTLAWVTSHQKSGEAIFPSSGKVWFQVCSDKNILCGFLTIWPNVFTNEIEAYQGGWDNTLVPFHSAARINRARLRKSLREWEQLCAGQIVVWSGELVETGVERYGFAEDAKHVTYV
jgi:hypothetical protein